MVCRRGQYRSIDERKKLIDLIGQAVTAGARFTQACKIVGIHPRTLQRWHKAESLVDKRTQRQYAPANKLSIKERQQIIEISNSNEYCHLPPCQIVPRLADQGCYVASESSFYRVLGEHKLLKHRQRSRPRSHSKPKELVAYQPNQVWSWDVTYLPTTVRGMFYYLYCVTDIYSRKIVGWTVQAVESSEHASWLMRDICQAEKIRPNQVTLHSDNGAIMKGATLLSTLEKLGVSTSFSRPAVSNDNPYSEALFKTLKYCSAYPENPFDSIDEARCWVERFVQWYNEEHYHSSLKFITPNQRHQGLARTILAKRSSVYQSAQLHHPERWSKNIRNWNLKNHVVLNPTGNTRRSEEKTLTTKDKIVINIIKSKNHNQKSQKMQN
jgi:transposase InsO family protein